MIRLSCQNFKGNQVRFQVRALAYDRIVIGGPTNGKPRL